MQANNAYSQNKRLSLKFSETDLINVLDKIEDESEYFFMYNEKLLATDRKVSIDAKDQLISSILDDLFVGTDVKYTITDHKIILAPVILTSVTQQTISGIVIDALTAQPMPGVNILVKGTLVGTQTDAGGKYKLPLQAANSVISFSFIGYNTQDITYTGQLVLDIKLAPKMNTMPNMYLISNILQGVWVLEVISQIHSFRNPQDRLLMSILILKVDWAK